MYIQKMFYIKDALALLLSKPLVWLLFIAVYVFLFPLPQAPSYKKNAVDSYQSALSFSFAYNGVFCGKFSYLSNTYDLRTASSDLREVPLDKWGEILGKSQKNYCETVTIPYTNFEQIHAFLYYLIIKLAPTLKIDDVLNIIGRLKAALVLSLIPVLLTLRINSFFVFFTFLISISLLRSYDKFYMETNHGLVFAEVIGFFAAQFFILTLKFKERPYVSLALLLLLSIVGGILMLSRTSYIPIVALSLVLFSYFYAAKNKFSFFQKSMVGIFLLSLSCGGATFILYKPQTPTNLPEAEKNINFSGTELNTSSVNYHCIWHPLVLSLGSIENDLAKREGIIFNDLRGLALAQKIDPSVVYLSKNYEESLKKYYLSLWSQYPWEMVTIYISRLGILPLLEGVEIYLKQSSFEKALYLAQAAYRKSSVIRFLFGLAFNSFLYMCIIAFIFVYSLKYFKKRYETQFAISYLCLWAFLLTLETLIVYPAPSPTTYYNYRYYICSLLCAFFILSTFVYFMWQEYAKKQRPLPKTHGGEGRERECAGELK